MNENDARRSAVGSSSIAHWTCDAVRSNQSARMCRPIPNENRRRLPWPRSEACARTCLRQTATVLECEGRLPVRYPKHSARLFLLSSAPCVSCRFWLPCKLRVLARRCAVAFVVAGFASSKRAWCNGYASVGGRLKIRSETIKPAMPQNTEPSLGVDCQPHSSRGDRDRCCVQFSSANLCLLP